MPSGLFGANAAWWALTILAFNLNAAMKRLALGERWAAKRMKALRFHLIGLPGRVVSHARQLIIGLGGGPERWPPSSTPAKGSGRWRRNRPDDPNRALSSVDLISRGVPWRGDDAPRPCQASRLAPVARNHRRTRHACRQTSGDDRPLGIVTLEPVNDRKIGHAPARAVICSGIVGDGSRLILEC